MKNRINLYRPELRPKLELLTLSAVFSLFGLLLVVVIGLRVWLEFSGSQKDRELAIVSNQVTQQSNFSDELNNTLQARTEDPQLLAIFAGLQTKLQDKEKLKKALSERETLKSESFSLLLKELAEQHQQDLWLTRIHVTEDAMIFDGQAMQPEALPRWITRLGETEYFAGKQFDQARIYREEQALKFTLLTDREEGQTGNAEGGE